MFHIYYISWNDVSKPVWQIKWKGSSSVPAGSQNRQTRPNQRETEKQVGNKSGNNLPHRTGRKKMETKVKHRKAGEVGLNTEEGVQLDTGETQKLG